jgi:hypothetical protein
MLMPSDLRHNANFKNDNYKLLKSIDKIYDGSFEN